MVDPLGLCKEHPMHPLTLMLLHIWKLLHRQVVLTIRIELICNKHALIFVDESIANFNRNIREKI